MVIPFHKCQVQSSVKIKNMGQQAQNHNSFDFRTFEEALIKHKELKNTAMQKDACNTGP